MQSVGKGGGKMTKAFVQQLGNGSVNGKEHAYSVKLSFTITIDQ